MELHRPRGFLLLEMVVAGTALPWLAGRVAARLSARAERYLDWLETVTEPLRTEVTAGRRTSIDDVKRAAAVDQLHETAVVSGVDADA